MTTISQIKVHRDYGVRSASMAQKVWKAVSEGEVQVRNNGRVFLTCDTPGRSASSSLQPGDLYV